MYICYIAYAVLSIYPSIQSIYLVLSIFAIPTPPLSGLLLAFLGTMGGRVTPPEQKSSRHPIPSRWSRPSSLASKALAGGPVLPGISCRSLDFLSTLFWLHVTCTSQRAFKKMKKNQVGPKTQILKPKMFLNPKPDSRVNINPEKTQLATALELLSSVMVRA